MKAIQTSRKSTRSTRRRSGGLILTTLAALSLVAGILLLVRVPARAQESPESLNAPLSAANSSLYSQIRRPNKDAYIAEKGTQTVQGIAWAEGTDVPYLTGDTMLSVDPVAGNEWSFWARWTEVVEATNYILQESTDPNFATLSDNIAAADIQHLVAKSPGEAGTYYYRVQALADDPGIDPTRWSNVVSATVPWTSVASGAPAATVGAAPADLATVQVRAGEPDTIESSSWQSASVTGTAWGGWTWSYQWSVPEVKKTQYLIQSRASEDGEGFGPIDTITVTLDTLNYYTYVPVVMRRWPPVPFAPSLNDISNSDNDSEYRISWSYSGASPTVPDPTSYTLQEDKDPAFSSPKSYYPGINRYYDMTDPEQEKGGVYYYRVRGHNSYGAGQWSNVVSTEVGFPPYAPTLSVYDPNKDGDITVEWTYDYEFPPVTSYTLWEDEDASFEDPAVYEVVGTSKELGDRPDGTCYKVRGNNDLGAGEWSNVVCIEVRTGLKDDFDDPDSGWDVRRTSAPDIDDDTDIDYKNGRLITKSEDNYDFAIFSPMREAPAYPYKITMKTRLKEGVDAPGYGIVFRGNRGDFCRVERDDAQDEDGCFYNYFRINITIDPGKHIRYEVKRIDEHDERGRAGGKDLSDGYHDVDNWADWDDWNTWRVEVKADQFKLYVNDHHLGTFYDDDYGRNKMFGILTSAYEYSPSVFEHEYFYVEPMD